MLAAVVVNGKLHHQIEEQVVLEVAAELHMMLHQVGEVLPRRQEKTVHQIPEAAEADQQALAANQPLEDLAALASSSFATN